MKIRIILLIIIVFFISCGKEKSALNKELLLTYYRLPEDSLKRMAVTFLLDNMMDQRSDIPGYSRSIITDSSSVKLLVPSYKTTPDSLVLNTKFLFSDINLAFDLWNKYPWANKTPPEIFLNYLLPYKIYGEEPANWRSFFSKKYKNTIRKMLQNIETESLINSTDEIYYKFLVDEVGQWFTYNYHPVRYSRYPGLNELMALKSSDCYGWSYLNVMILRSLGIPSTIDIIPLWGRKNGSHYTEVFWDNELQRFRTASGRELDHPAKVFRYTFKRQGVHTDSILPIINKPNIFLLNFLKHDHWLDVTHEHALTATVDYECNVSSGFAYICVFNYGQWIPIYWGKVKDGNVRFENMGTGILYRIAVPEKNSYKPASPVFCLNEKGNIIFFQPNRDEKKDLYLSQLNTGERSWVEAGKNYSLYYYDGTNDWTFFEAHKCEKDSLIVFKGIPSSTLYQLLDTEQKQRLERIFTYENGEQVWW